MDKGIYQYVIKSVVPSRPDSLPDGQRQWIIGERCTPDNIRVGCKCALLIERYNLEPSHYYRWYYTSLVCSHHTEPSGDLVIETLNSVYTLTPIRKEDNRDLS